MYCLILAIPLHLQFSTLSGGQLQLSKGLNLEAGQLTVDGGLRVPESGVQITSGDFTNSAGSMSVVGSSTAIVDVTTSSGAFAGNLIYAGVLGGATTNALVLLEGTNVLFKVRILVFLL